MHFTKDEKICAVDMVCDSLMDYYGEDNSVKYYGSKLFYLEIRPTLYLRKCYRD